MPKVEMQRELFHALLKEDLVDEELVRLLPVAKAELDGYDDRQGIYKIEFNDTNRPDLWSAAGLARQLRSYRTGYRPSYDFFSTAKQSLDACGRSLIVHESAGLVRPFSIGFAITGKKVDEPMLLHLIQSQEKLCTNFGRKRKTIAIGIYRSDLITYPVHFAGVDPDIAHFIPLHMEEDLTLRQICEKHPKGIEYGPIVADKSVFPLLYDDTGEVLSFPPVINSAKLGAVQVNDERLFFELSGTVLDDLVIASSILACDCADMGCTILPVRCLFPYDTPYGREITIPYYFQKPILCDLTYIRKTLGEMLEETEVIDALTRMGLSAEHDVGKVRVTVPPYRNDFLHPVDVVEDVMIGYGMENFSMDFPDDFTIGRLTEIEEFSRKVKEIMIGMGFQEMMYNYLGSRKHYIENMHGDDTGCILIANPMSENYEVVRPSILPSLLASESVSAHAVYPHLIFEVGKVAFLDETDNSGTVTRNYLGFLCSSREMGFNQLNSFLSTLLYFLDRECSLSDVVDARFIEGRSAVLHYGNTKVGVCGEVHPAVLESWGITMPTVACEIDIDLLLKQSGDNKESC